MARDSGDNFSFLRDLQSHVVRYQVKCIWSEGFRTPFSIFRESLTFISLGRFVTSFSAFVILVDYSPNLTTLRLLLLVLEPDRGPVLTRQITLLSLSL